jgi:hypothetical protein
MSLEPIGAFSQHLPQYDESFTGHQVCRRSRDGRREHRPLVMRLINETVLARHRLHSGAYSGRWYQPDHREDSRGERLVMRPARVEGSEEGPHFGAFVGVENVGRGVEYL